jgi:hypothetical protein
MRPTLPLSQTRDDGSYRHPGNCAGYRAVDGYRRDVDVYPKREREGKESHFHDVRREPVESDGILSSPTNL